MEFVLNMEGVLKMGTDLNGWLGVLAQVWRV
jgi:hypothetical protein